MARLDIRAVAMPTLAATFTRFPASLYRGDPHYVPPLASERRTFLDPCKNPYFQHASVACFVALRDGAPVGTIAATVDKAYQKAEPGTGFFGFYDFVEDPDIPRCLLETARGWLRAQGMRRAIGPLNFNSNHGGGLLVDGFDRDPVVFTTYNPRYYPTTYAALGLEKERDLYGYWVEAGPVPPRITAITDRLLRHQPGLRLRPLDLGRFAEEAATAYRLYHDAWSDNWGFVRMSEAEFTFTAKALRPMLDPRLCSVVELDGQPVAFSVTLADMNEVLKPMKGSFLPFGWWHWFTRRSRVHALRVLMLGVGRQHQHLPLSALLYRRTWEAALELGVRGVEAPWIVEDDLPMRRALVKLGGRIHKTWRIYGCDL